MNIFHKNSNYLLKKGTTKPFEWLAMFSLLVLLTVMPASWAQAAGPRPTCNDDSVVGCIDELQNEEYDEMLDQVDAEKGKISCI